MVKSCSVPVPRAGAGSIHLLPREDRDSAKQIVGIESSAPVMGNVVDRRHGPAGMPGAFVRLYIALHRNAAERACTETSRSYRRPSVGFCGCGCSHTPRCFRRLPRQAKRRKLVTSSSRRRSPTTSWAGTAFSMTYPMWPTMQKAGMRHAEEPVVKQRDAPRCRSRRQPMIEPAKLRAWSICRSCVVPGIKNRNTCALIAAAVARHNGQPMMQRRCGDDEIGLRKSVSRLATFFQ